MTIIKHTLPDYKAISILPLADLHMGDINCDFKRVMGWIDYVKDTPVIHLDGTRRRATATL